MQKAGWVFVDWKGPKAFEKLNWTMQPHVYGVANASNVSIELNPEYRERLMPAANAIATALNDVGIDAVVEGGIVGSSSGNIDAIHVLVGAKETFFLDRLSASRIHSCVRIDGDGPELIGIF